MTLENFVQQAIDRIQDIAIDFPDDGPAQRTEIKFVLLDLLTHGSETAVIHPALRAEFLLPAKLDAQGELDVEAPTSLTAPDMVAPVSGKCSRRVRNHTGGIEPGDLVEVVAPFEPTPGFRFQLLPDDARA